MATLIKLLHSSSLISVAIESPIQSELHHVTFQFLLKITTIYIIFVCDHVISDGICLLHLFNQFLELCSKYMASTEVPAQELVIPTIGPVDSYP
jgi:hypothetical protein